MSDLLENKGVTRRTFVRGLGLTGGFYLVKGPAKVLFGKPELVFGVVSDVHGTDPSNRAYFKKALEWFRDEDADAVMSPGDFTVFSGEWEFEKFASVWWDVFPDDRMPNGRKMIKLFLTGNHDVDGWTYQSGSGPEQRAAAQKNSFCFNREAFWRKFFHEEYAPVIVKEVKGYKFVLANWYARSGGADEVNPLPGWMAEHAHELPRDKPFFYAQHELPRGGCNAPWAASGACDSGQVEAAFKTYPNAVVFSGHSHYPLTDELSIRQPSYTSINAGATNAWPETYEGRENGNPGGCMPMIDRGMGRQALLVRVYKDRIVVERRDLIHSERVGADWVFPVGMQAARPYSDEARKSSTEIPEFPKGTPVKVERAKLVISPRKPSGPVTREEGGPCLRVSFPAVSGLVPPNVRAFDYAVEPVLLMKDGSELIGKVRYVFSDKCMLAPRRDTEAWCDFPVEDFEGAVKVWFRVAPRDCFQRMGKYAPSEVMPLA